MKIPIILLFVASSAMASPMQSTQVLNTGAFINDGQQLSVPPWINNSGRNMFIKGFLPWVGVDCHVIADVTFIVQRGSDASILYQHPVDHYSDGPDGNGRISMFQGGDYFLLRPGDYLVFTCRSLGMNFTRDWPNWNTFTADQWHSSWQAITGSWAQEQAVTTHTQQTFLIYFTYDQP